MHKNRIHKLVDEFTYFSNRGNMRASSALLPEIIQLLVKMIEGETEAPAAVELTEADKATLGEIQTTVTEDGRKMFSVDVGDLSPERAKDIVAGFVAAKDGVAPLAEDEIVVDENDAQSEDADLPAAAVEEAAPAVVADAPVEAAAVEESAVETPAVEEAAAEEPAADETVAEKPRGKKK